MKQRLFLLLMIVGLVGVLVLLNALTYVQTQKQAEADAKLLCKEPKAHVPPAPRNSG